MPRFTAEWPGTLLDAMREAYPEWKPHTLRLRLKAGLVRVNDVTEHSGGRRLETGDRVEVLSRPAAERVLFPAHLGEPPLAILYSDRDLLAVDKPPGLLSVATAREKNLTAIRVMREWLAGLGAESRDSLHAAHRLDREASGVLLLVRSPGVKKKLAAAWHSYDKTYLAVTDGIPDEREGVIDIPLREDKALFVRPAPTGGGEAAVTRYRTMRTGGGRALLEVKLGTGRKHQIRVHLASIGCPIVGDLRYGRSKAKRLALHASRLSLIHPATGAETVIVSPTPRFFANRLKGRG